MSRQRQPRAEACEHCGEPVPESSPHVHFCSKRCCNALYVRSEQGKAAHRRYRATEKGLATKRTAQRRYASTERGRATQRARQRQYKSTERGLAARRRYAASEAGRAASRRRYATEHGRAAKRQSNAKRKYGPDLAPAVIARLEVEDWIRENVDPAVVAEVKAALRGEKE